jgi:hypothetical protein
MDKSEVTVNDMLVSLIVEEALGQAETVVTKVLSRRVGDWSPALDEAMQNTLTEVVDKIKKAVTEIIAGGKTPDDQAKELFNAVTEIATEIVNREIEKAIAAGTDVLRPGVDDGQVQVQGV